MWVAALGRPMVQSLSVFGWPRAEESVVVWEAPMALKLWVAR